MNISKTTLSKIDKIVEIADYGLSWGRYDEGRIEEEYESYYNGIVEGVAHIMACCVAQWVTKNSTPTWEMIDYIGLSKFPDKKAMKKRLIKWVKEA